MKPGDERGEAFVVWLDPLPGRDLRGRVERIATSQRVRFASAEELVAVLIEAIDRDAAKEP